MTLYAYFPQGREELFRELYEQINGNLIEKASETYAADGRFNTRIVALTENLMTIAEKPLIGRFYSIDDPALDNALNPVRGHASHFIANLIAKDLASAQESQLRPPRRQR